MSFVNIHMSSIETSSVTNSNPCIATSAAALMQSKAVEYKRC